MNWHIEKEILILAYQRGAKWAALICRYQELNDWKECDYVANRIINEKEFSSEMEFVSNANFRELMWNDVEINLYKFESKVWKEDEIEEIG